MNKKNLILIFIAFLFATTSVCAKEKDYFQIYDSLVPADFDYIFGLDPYQTEDYVRYKLSPYPLLRSGVDFHFKGITISKGYYLLTPRTKNGKDYVLFKQAGKVLYTIPVYKKEVVDPTFYKLHVPVPKKTKWQKFCGSLSNFVGRVSKDSKRTPPPLAYIEVNEVQNRFWELILYYGVNKYHLLFLKD